MSEGDPPGPSDLGQIQARRRQLFRLLLLVFALVAAGIVVFSYASELLFGRELAFLDVAVLRISFVVLAVAFAVYVWTKERELSRREATFIQERLQAERQRAESARLEERDRERRELLALVTHDLKGPLTGILGYARLLRDRGEAATPEHRREFTEAIEQQGRRMLDMLEQLIVATSLEEGAPTLSREPLDLPAMVDTGVDAFRGAFGDREVEVRVPPELPTVYGDRSAVEHILVNLLDNAVKYSPVDAPIEVEVEGAEGEVRVTVSDRGPGIAEEVLPHVFDRYHRAEGRGEGGSVGLGLFIVRRLTEGHGGRVWASNGPDGGTRVTFSLPVRR